MLLQIARTEITRQVASPGCLYHEDITGDCRPGVGADDVRVLGGADLRLEAADGSEVVTPVKATRAKEAAVELLHEDGTECRADGGASDGGLTEESKPQIWCLGFNLNVNYVSGMDSDCAIDAADTHLGTQVWVDSCKRIVRVPLSGYAFILPRCDIAPSPFSIGMPTNFPVTQHGPISMIPEQRSDMRSYGSSYHRL